MSVYTLRVSPVVRAICKRTSLVKTGSWQVRARLVSTSCVRHTAVVPARESYDAETFRPKKDDLSDTSNNAPEGAKEKHLMEYIKMVAARHPECLLVTQVGSFYELYGDDAAEWAPKLDLKLAKKGMGGGIKTHMAGFPVSQRDRYLARIVTRFQQPVVLLEQAENIALYADNESKRRVTRVITPGTLVGDSFMDRDSKSYLASVCLPQSSLAKDKVDAESPVGLAWLDVSDGSFFYQSTTLGLLMSDLARIRPREIILDKKTRRFAVDSGDVLPDLAELRDYHLMYVDFALPEALPSFAGMFNDSRSMVRYLRDHEMSHHESKAVTAVLSFVRDKLPDSDIVVKWPERHDPAQVMRMDSRSRQALEIESNYSGTSTRGSLHSAIKRTQTDSGARLLEEWLSSPLTSVDKIRQRQDIVEYLVKRTPFRAHLASMIRGREDTARVVQRLGIRKSASDLVRFARSSLLFRDIRNYLSEELQGAHAAANTDFIRSWIDVLGRSLDEQLKVGQEILEGIDERAVLLEETAEGTPGAASATDGLEFQPIFKPSASKRLQDLYAAHEHFDGRRLELGQRIEEQVNDALKQKGKNRPKIKVSLKHSPRFKYHLHLRLDGKNQLMEDILDDIKAYVPGGILNQNKKTLCIQNREWEVLGMERDRFSDNIKIEESRLLKRLAKRVIALSDKANACSSVLDVIDVTQSFASLASEMQLVRPELDYSTDFDIRGGRHIVVELGLQSDGQFFTENDCNLDGELRSLLITGPNMGGKSTYIRQVALITILAQVGCFVPAAYARLGLVDQIFCRVGAGDDLFHGRSTFMMEMLETSNILRNATSRSLAILDEVGRGTSPREGLAIAYATLRHVLQVNKCRTLFATHFGKELADLMDKNNVASGLDYFKTSLDFDEDGGLLFNHRLEHGISGMSHGLAVAALAGFPETALANARDALAQDPKHLASKL